MALTREKKERIVDELSELLKGSKMTVVAEYKGTPVKAMQTLRRQGGDNATVFKIVKNRLVKLALSSNDTLKDADTSALEGMLLYAFNDQDEVAPAQVLANFAKTQPTLEFVGAYSAEGKFLSADDVKALATLPGKTELIAQVMATLGSPVNDVMGGLSGDLHGILTAVEAKASA